MDNTERTDQRPSLENAEQPVKQVGFNPAGSPEGQFITAGAGLREQMDATVKACAQALHQVLELHGCIMTAEPYITPDGRIAGNIAIRIGTPDPEG